MNDLKTAIFASLMLVLVWGVEYAKAEPPVKSDEIADDGGPVVDDPTVNRPRFWLRR